MSEGVNLGISLPQLSSLRMRKLPAGRVYRGRRERLPPRHSDARCQRLHLEEWPDAALRVLGHLRPLQSSSLSYYRATRLKKTKAVRTFASLLR